MKRIYMKNRHNPETGTYGDCLSAAIGSLLECDDVPHFNFDGCTDQDEVRRRINDYLNAHHALAVYCTGWNGSIKLSELMAMHAHNNPGMNYLLSGALVSGEPHMVVCRDAQVIHDPSPWPTGGIVAPYEGVWVIMTLVSEVVCYE
jgi:hypothetical protein